MKIVPLGTSSGVPTLERGVTGLAAFVGSEKKRILVDCGEGTQQRIMRSGSSLSPDSPKLGWGELEAILITHGHGDHCFGLFGILAMMSMSGRSRPLPIVAPAEVRAMAEAVLAHSHTHLTYPISWSAPSAGSVVELFDGVRVSAVEMAHRASSHGYLIESEKIRGSANAGLLAARGFAEGPQMGKAIACLKRGESVGAPDGSIVEPREAIEFEKISESLFVGGDNSEPDRVAKAAPGALCWVHEATYAQEDWAHGGAGLKWGHSSAEMVGKAAAAGQPSALVLTHFSPRYGEGPMGVDRLGAEASLHYAGPVHLALDLAALEFAPRREPVASPSKKAKPQA